MLVICSVAMALLFWIALAGGRDAAVFALPATGLFMSVLYPTMNSTGINCFPRSKHGTIAGLLLFFTCVGAVVAPLAMGAAGDLLQSTRYSMALGAVFATALAVLCCWNFVRRPMERRLMERNEADYGAAAEGGAGPKPAL